LTGALVDLHRVGARVDPTVEGAAAIALVFGFVFKVLVADRSCGGKAAGAGMPVATEGRVFSQHRLGISWCHIWSPFGLKLD